MLPFLAQQISYPRKIGHTSMHKMCNCGLIHCICTTWPLILFCTLQHYIGDNYSHFISQAEKDQRQSNKELFNHSGEMFCVGCMCPFMSFNICHISFLFLRLSEVDHFQKVLEHEAFKEDPLSAIAQHVTNAVAKHVL